MKVHHIGYAVNDIQKSLVMFQKIGYTIESGPVKDIKRNVEIAFIQNNNYNIELIAPLNNDSPIKNYLNKVGNTPYHICYETDNILTTINELKKQRYIVIEKPSEAIALESLRIAFLYHPFYGLLELLERKKIEQ
jgi:methylmalonyl-CoA/ethylmalonyl-CoA epimerase